jgi:STE24 endopeptidase
MTPGELAEAKKYGRVGLLCSLVDMAVDLSVLAVAAFVLAKPADAWLARRLGESGILASATVRLALLYALVYALHLAASAPLSYYSGFVVEHRFGLSRQTLGAWLREFAMHNVLGFSFNLFMFCGLFWVFWAAGPWWWLVAAALWFLVAVMMGQLAPVLILPLFYKIEPLDDRALVDRLRRRADGTGMSIEGVYRMGMASKTAKANAMLAGVGRTRRVLLGDTLLQQFTPEEIEVVFAHEIGHHVHRHIRNFLFIGAAIGLAGFFLCDRLLALWIGAAHYDPAMLPTDALPLVMFYLLVFSIVTGPIQNALSRRNERQADRYALRCTGDRQALVTAFGKLARQNKADPDPHPLEVVLFHSHPTIAERVAAASR